MALTHLCQWMLEPVAKLIAQEATEKLGTAVRINVAKPLVAYDMGGKARAVSAIIGALAEAKQAGIDPKPAMRIFECEDLFSSCEVPSSAGEGHHEKGR